MSVKLDAIARLRSALVYLGDEANRVKIPQIAEAIHLVVVKLDEVASEKDTPPKDPRRTPRPH